MYIEKYIDTFGDMDVSGRRQERKLLLGENSKTGAFSKLLLRM